MDKHLLDQILAHTSDSITITDKEGFILCASRIKANHHGYEDGEEIVGCHESEFFTAEEYGKIRNEQLQVMETQRTISDRLEPIERDGKKWYSVGRSPYYNKHREIAGVVNWSRNITPRMTVEENLKLFFRNSLHEIASLAVAAGGYAGRIIRGRCGDADESVKGTLSNVHKIIERIESECRQMCIQVDTLGAEKSLVKKNHTVDVGGDLLPKIMTLFDLMMDEKKMKYDNTLHSIPPGSVILKTNPDLLGYIFKTLIGNAVKYCKEGGIIAIGYEIRETHIVFNVYDNGDPPSEDFIRGAMFRKFQSENPDGNSSGIGLYSVKETARMLGGEVGGDAWYETTSSNHNNFLFSVPLADLVSE
jgi:PAS domain S-box-containing protein